VDSHSQLIRNHGHPASSDEAGAGQRGVSCGLASPPQRRLEDQEENTNIIITIIIGGIIGWLASMIMKTNAQMGILANIVVGIIGSFLGFWLAGLIGVAATNNVVRWIIAVVGAAILIAILKALKIFK
jgi:uncharacterized membrane protein YeaQ/YmgE (transglycosylase-associated protein family)